MNKHRIRLFIQLLLMLALLPVFAGWLGDVFKDWVGGQSLSQADPYLAIIGLVAILLIAWWMLKTGEELVGVANIEETSVVVPHKSVIALLSPCKNLVPPENGGDDWRVKDRSGREASLAGRTLDQITEKEATDAQGQQLPQWTWQQILRAAHHHGNALEKLVLLGSTGGSGTDQQLRLARRFFKHYFPGKVMVMGLPEGDPDTSGAGWTADFEKLDDLSHLLLKTLKHLRKQQGYQDKDIIIDCTGGQKIASIACALVTLDRPKLSFQYVGTGARTGRVIGFNVVTESRAG